VKHLVVVVVILSAWSGALAQSQATQPTFDVVSVKLNPNGGRNIGDFPRQFRFAAGGREFEMIEGAVIAMIRYAYPTVGNEIRDIPAWVSSERYDVKARTGEPATVPQRRAMIGALLASRFNFRFHYETVEQPVYRLVRVRPDGPLHPNLKRSSTDCAAVRAARERGEPPATPPQPGAQLCSMGYGGGSVAARGIPMADLAAVISADAGRVVLDATNLEGDFEFLLQWDPQPLADNQNDLTSLFVALEEQLGLKLQADRAPLRIIRVENIQRPSAD
jgi:uncharacterized protein (TIGR03435 family)